MSEEMMVVKYNGVPVVTTKQIAEAYGTSAKRVSSNFNANKKRYTEGKHYFAIKGEEKSDFLNRPENQDAYLNRPEIRDGLKKAKFLYLWTERGALLLAKSINTDTAWQAYERLVDFYFEKKNEQIPTLPEVAAVNQIPYQTSSTPVPKNPSWYSRNRRRLYNLSEKYNIPLKGIYHHVLVRLGEEYDLDAANEIYERENGYPPEYAIDIVSYFPELGRMADAYLSRLEKLG